MIDWDKYRWLSPLLLGGYTDRTKAQSDLDRLLADTRRSERERCADVCRGLKQHSSSGATHQERVKRNWPFEACAKEIEALEDEP